MTITKEKKYNTSILWYSLGVELEESGKFEEAIESYDKAIELDPNDTDTWCSRGNALASLEQFYAAIKSYDIAIKLNRQNSSARQGKAYSWHRIGEISSQEGKVQEAALCFRKSRNSLK